LLIDVQTFFQKGIRLVFYNREVQKERSNAPKYIENEKRGVVVTTTCSFYFYHTAGTWYVINK